MQRNILTMEVATGRECRPCNMHTVLFVYLYHLWCLYLISFNFHDSFIPYHQGCFNYTGKSHAYSGLLLTKKMQSHWYRNPLYTYIRRLWFIARIPIPIRFLVNRGLGMLLRERQTEIKRIIISMGTRMFIIWMYHYRFKKHECMFVYEIYPIVQMTGWPTLKFVSGKMTT